MARTTNATIVNNFIGGLNTEATALNFPPNAVIDQQNCVFSERGIVSRRLGMEFENNFVTNTQNRTQMAQTSYYWLNASGDGATNLVVQQNGQTLTFYNTSSNLSLSSGQVGTTVSLTSFQSSGSTTDNLNQNECQYSTGLGFLFVVHPYCDPFFVQYNPSSNNFTASIITFTIRDVNGLTEAGLITNRPTTLTANHEYNLLNQGWTSALWTKFDTAASAFPSNCDVWWTFNDDTDTFNPATTLASVGPGSSPAPQGFFRLNPWNTARAATALAQAGVSLTLTGSNIDQSSGTLRPTVTEFHAGRIWYTGVNAASYNGLVYFTEVVQDNTSFGYCASVDDPTSQTAFDFVASDGGIIAIPQAGTIYKLISLGPNLIVFGANGVWAITGSQGVGFAADNYNVAPLSYIRSISGTSYVVADGNIYWWNGSDIVILTQGDTGYNVQSISYNKIKEFYNNDISLQSKKAARGAYNPQTHLIQWLFTSTTPGDLTGTYTYDSVLTFNLLSQAFYTWTVDTTLASVNSITVIQGAGSVTGTSNVIDNATDQVIDANGDIVQTFGFANTTIETTTKFLCSYPNGSGSYNFTFAESFDPGYRDWTFVNNIGTDYVSDFTTGYAVKTQGERRFQSNYIYVFNDLSNVANQGFPSYTFQALWDYGSSGNSGEFTQKQTIAQLVTHNETNFSAGRRRLKVRGSGFTVQFKFISVSGKPFNIVGWSTFDTAEQSP